MEPIRLMLRPGQAVIIEFFETDGEITVDFDSKGNSTLSVSADLPDSFGRSGELYREEFGAGGTDQGEEDHRVYKTIFQVEVLSEGPLELPGRDDDPFDLKAIDYMITVGNAIGRVSETYSRPIPKSEIERTLMDMGNDGDFFSHIVDNDEEK